MTKGALREYRAKRDFSRTREPSGSRATFKGSRGKTRSFTVQKHDASRLHYDLRLELEGTLKSWAVPKGPSLDPSVSRLAIQVEDHPIEYGTFEGSIPEGEYGGGEVLLWDRGTWEPLRGSDPAADYRKGKLHFVLHGHKLSGEWLLLRTREEGTQVQWLLKKISDESAKGEAAGTITDERPESVKSGRTLDEMRGKKRGGPRRKVGAKGRRPSSHAGKRYPFQLATLVTAVPEGKGWVHEVKIDGYRMQGIVNAGKSVLISRNGIDYTSELPGVASALAALPVRSGVFDGEIAVQDEKGRTDFQLLQNALSTGEGNHAIYFLFDLLELNGEDLRKRPLLQRRARLEKILKGKKGGALLLNKIIEGEGDQIMTQACHLGLEGIISKRSDGVYEGRRSRDWVKTKCHRRQEFVIGGSTPSSNRSYPFGALLLGYYSEKGELRYAGKVGTGFTAESRRVVAARLRESTTDTSPFADRSTVRGAVKWSLPTLVCEVEFTEWTGEGRLRHPSFQGLREDKNPREVGREKAAPPVDTGHRPPKPTRAPSQERKAKGAGGSTVEVGGVALSHGERPIYPGSDLTKRSLAEFYIEFAPLVLPLMRDRPLMIIRCPGGGSARCFVQKHAAEGTPAEISRVRLKEGRSMVDYVTIKNARDIVHLIQLNVIEFHSWGSRNDRVDRPDEIIFDLDPDTSLEWARVVEAAVNLGEFLGMMGLAAYPKVTGGKGVHIVAPLRRRSTWDEVKERAHAIAEVFSSLHPGEFTTNMNKRKRRGKIFIDYLRNGRGATSILPFSPRARPETLFAVPLSWEELAAGNREFSLAALTRRLADAATSKKLPWTIPPPNSLPSPKEIAVAQKESEKSS